MAHWYLAQEGASSWNEINRTRLFVVIQGTLGGLAGMVHGLFAILLGNKPTGGMILDPATGAFTILPTYLLSGIASICVGLALIGWTIGFIHRKNGPAIFLVIFILLFLVGGGIAQVGFFLITWAVSTRIHHPLNMWKRDRSGNSRKQLARLWLALFTGGYLFLLAGIAIWLILTPPGTSYPDHISAYWICWSSLIIGLILQILTILSGFAGDLERQGKYAPNH